MEPWQNFFLGELGASAALAGLIFVSLSVNQARILAIPSLPERGMQTLMSLFLVLVVSSIIMVPGQPPWLVGAEILIVSGGQIVLLTMAQRIALRLIAAKYLGSTWKLAITNQLASWLFVLAGALLMARGDWIGLYALVPGTLLSFTVSGLNAWILLIEINR